MIHSPMSPGSRPERSYSEPVDIELDDIGSLLSMAAASVPGQTLFSSNRGDRFTYGADPLELTEAVLCFEHALMQWQDGAEKTGGNSRPEPSSRQVFKSHHAGVRRVIEAFAIAPGVDLMVDAEFDIAVVPHDGQPPLAKSLHISTLETSDVPAAA